MNSVDVLVENAAELVTMRGPLRARRGQEMRDIGVVSGGSVAISDGRIVSVGRNLSVEADEVVDAAGKTVVPGFVDPHTHVVFAGARAFELDMKLQGASYMEILQKGGGIFSTVEQTRKASVSQLYRESVRRLDTMLAYGTTTCEAKSGYGLNLDTEVKLLEVAGRLHERHAMDVVSTFLGAHAVPRDMDAEVYVDLVVEEMLPAVKELCCFCDVFCEEGVFTVDQSRRILSAGKTYGLKPKLHADEIVDTGGARLAADVGAVSADHLLMSSKSGLQQMAKKGVIAVLLPGTPFSLMQKDYAAGREMIDMGLAVALATDLNPNCWTENMQFMMQLGCLMMKLTPAEALCAATFNAACAIDRQKVVGSLEKGKQADVVVLDCPSYQHIPYHFGINLVDTVIKNGVVI